MRFGLIAALVTASFALNGCGVETASSAATAAALKAEEAKEAKKTVDRARAKIADATAAAKAARSE
ncbi:MAG: hypothetical protein AAF493_01575 [Pseudomonadota bacterium]